MFAELGQIIIVKFGIVWKDEGFNRVAINCYYQDMSSNDHRSCFIYGMCEAPTPQPQKPV